MRRLLARYRLLGPFLTASDECKVTDCGLDAIDGILKSDNPEEYAETVGFEHLAGGFDTLILIDRSSSLIQGDCVLKVNNRQGLGNEITTQVDLWNNASPTVKDDLAKIHSYSDEWLLMERGSGVAEEQFIQFVKDITAKGWYMNNMSMAEVADFGGDVKIIEYIFNIEEVESEEHRRRIIERAESNKLI